MFGITITELKKCIGVRESKVPFSHWNWKILVWLKHFFYQNIYFIHRVSKGKNIKGIKRQLRGNALFVNCYIFCLLFNHWAHFESMSSFHTWNIYIYIYTIYTSNLLNWLTWVFWIFWILLFAFKGLRFTILMVCNNILFSIFARNVFTAPLPLISGRSSVLGAKTGQTFLKTLRIIIRIKELYGSS